jgi:hypothetical protein
MENVYEQFFFLKHFGGWSFVEAYNLPIGLRDWFVNKLMDHLEMEQKARENSSSSNTQTLSSINQPRRPPGLGNK